MMKIKGAYTDATVYTDTADSETLSQIRTLCDQPFAQDSHPRFMSDCHAGAGCVIGTTMHIRDKVVPNMVGVDIGCGVKVLHIGPRPDLKGLDEFIRRNIPSGFRNNDKSMARMDTILDLKCYDMIKRANYFLALGSLGGGNHFIEVDVDQEGEHYLLIHSGSRNLGLQIAKYYQSHAEWEMSEGIKREIEDAHYKGLTGPAMGAKVEEIRRKYGVPRDLAYLEGKAMDRYIHDMRIAQEYAMLNRDTMARRIVEEFLHLDYDDCDGFTSVHNYIDMWRMILRKGAVSARWGENLVIPINMRDGSLLCRGKGNPEWNFSAPHGAGRIMGRREAKRRLELNEFKQTMEGIYSTSVSADTIDESPMVYKPMTEIVANIQDTVEVLDIIMPVYNFKAGGE
jgi:RNA-splicing ligase RtcB